MKSVIREGLVVRAIILAGGPAHDEAGYPMGLPRPLWPALMKPMVLRLIERLVRGGASGLSLCANGRTSLYAARLAREPLGLAELCFVQDPLPRGPAGCIKDAEAFIQGETFAVVHAARWLDEDLESLMHRHRAQGNSMTVFYSGRARAAAGVYVCEPEILDHIPAVGYCDLKEQLIPRLLDRGLRVGVLPLRQPGVEVVNVSTYLGLHRYLLSTQLEREVGACPGSYVQVGPDVWTAVDAEVGKRVRLFGPVIVGPGAKIMDGAVVIGPACVGPGTTLGQDCIVTECAIWADARVVAGACVDRTLIAAKRPLDGNLEQVNRRPIQGSVAVGEQ